MNSNDAFNFTLENLGMIQKEQTFAFAKSSNER